MRPSVRATIRMCSLWKSRSQATSPSTPFRWFAGRTIRIHRPKSIRVSLQRQAALVDYFVHNGTNARVWVQLTSEADLVNVPAKTQVLSRLERTNVRIPPGSSALDDALRQHSMVFETIHPTTLFAAH